jgi:putative transposase
MRFPIDVMLVCLRGYAACPFRYRPLEEMLEERGPSVVHCGMSVGMVMWATERLAITIEA